MDIVDELRRAANGCPLDGSASLVECSFYTLARAADEIERLRAQNMNLYAQPKENANGQGI
jgi:hypothetical protein